MQNIKISGLKGLFGAGFSVACFLLLSGANVSGADYDGSSIEWKLDAGLEKERFQLIKTYMSCLIYQMKLAIQQINKYKINLKSSLYESNNTKNKKCYSKKYCTALGSNQGPPA